MTTTFNKKASTLGDINELISALRSDYEKSAEANTEPGGTTHPVKDEDDRTEPATEGARSSENEKDVKEDQGPLSVENAPKGQPGEQESMQMNVGITSESTGKSPDSETKSTKPGKEDSETTHPAKTDNDSLDGHKWSSVLPRYQNLVDQVVKSGEDLCAELTRELNQKPGGHKQAGDKQSRDEQAGQELAFSLTDQEKQAADSLVLEAVDGCVVRGFDMAEKTANYIVNSFRENARAKAARQKKSQGGPPPEEEAPAEDPAMSEEGGEEGGDPMGGMGGGMGGLTEEDLLALLSQGEGMGAEDAAGGMGGDPMGGMGGDPMGGMGGGEMGPEGMGPEGMGGGMPPGGGMGGGMGGEMGGGEGGSEEEQLAMLQQVLQEMGKTAEDLQAQVLMNQASALTSKRSSTKPASHRHDEKKLAAVRQSVQDIFSNR